jgi:hypothetical protein
MKNILPRLPDQIIRLSIVFILLIGGIFIVRHYIIPPQLKETGFQRTSAIKKETLKKVKYAGSLICIECHDEEYRIKREGYHKNLSCETCHGAAKSHTDNPMELKPFAPRGRKFCPMCHTYNPSRPTGFPQINPVVHNPMKPCITCHNPHNPEPPETPRECIACHAEIARTKAISYHVLLKCTVCHNVPNKHKITPRVVKATKPTKREFCGKCHSKDSKVKGPPKIDLFTHNEKYVCWQCHYPHMPGVM